jgi:long-chain acyl-CoA synthetase
VVSGGAPLSPSVQAWFEAIGVSVREGWGLTETSGPVTLNPAVAYRPGSVGVALPGSSVDVSADGELLVRGPGVFAGYLNDDAATQAAFTPAGFFRTGDLGMIDDDGYVWIMGRRKEILVTAGGKNVPPVPMERLLETSPLIERAILVGDRRPYLCVLLALDEEVLAAHAAVGSWPGDVAVWRTRQSVRASVQQHIDAINTTVASYETIKAFAFLPRPLTEEGRELTPTLKLRRALIAKKYAALIDALYA